METHARGGHLRPFVRHSLIFLRTLNPFQEPFQEHSFQEHMATDFDNGWSAAAVVGSPITRGDSEWSAISPLTDS
jgi:hypothetical protein